MRRVLTCWMALLVCVGTSRTGSVWLCLGAEGHVGLQAAPTASCNESARHGAFTAATHSAYASMRDRSSRGPCVDFPLGSVAPHVHTRPLRRSAGDSAVPSIAVAAVPFAAKAAPARGVAIDGFYGARPPSSGFLATVVLLI